MHHKIRWLCLIASSAAALAGVGAVSALAATTPASGKVVVPSHVALVHNLLPVRGNTITVALKCVSRKACTGRMTVSKRTFVRVKKKLVFVTLRCTASQFAIGARKTKALKSKVGAGCMRLINTSAHRHLVAVLHVIVTSGQRGLRKVVVVQRA